MSIVPAGTYQDLAGNSGAGDLNATVPVSVLSTDSTLASTASGSHSQLSPRSLAGVIIGVILGVFALVLLCSLVSMQASHAHTCWFEYTTAIS